MLCCSSGSCGLKNRNTKIITFFAVITTDDMMLLWRQQLATKTARDFLQENYCHTKWFFIATDLDTCQKHRIIVKIDGSSAEKTSSKIELNFQPPHRISFLFRSSFGKRGRALLLGCGFPPSHISLYALQYTTISLYAKRGFPLALLSVLFRKAPLLEAFSF